MRLLRCTGLQVQQTASKPPACHHVASLPAAAEANEHAEAASLARREADEARREAGLQAQQTQQLRSELWAMEARANLAGYGTPEGGQSRPFSVGAGCLALKRILNHPLRTQYSPQRTRCMPPSSANMSGHPWCVGVAQHEQEGSISLQQPGTAYLTVGDEAAVDGPVGAAAAGDEQVEPEPDVFSSPLADSLRREGRASNSPAPHQQVQQRTPANGSSQGGPSFRFVSAAGGGEAEDEDAASSGGESEATVSEAAVVARTLTRASALQKDREQLRQQVRHLSQELRELKGKQRGMAQSMRDAAAEGGGAAGGASSARTQHTRAQQQHTRVAAGGGDAALEERCRLQAVEERHLRSEVDTLNRKVGRRLGAGANSAAWPKLVWRADRS